MVSPNDLDRLAELETQARLADAVIERTKVADLASLDFEQMTVGEVITLANAVEAIRSLTEADKELKAAEDAPNSYPGGPTTERRDDALRRLSGMIGDLIPPDSEVETVNGPIKYGDIPKDEDGALLPGWLAANCTCPEHRAARNNPSDSTIARGLYL
jgi:hypothetical protein